MQYSFCWKALDAKSAIRTKFAENHVVVNWAPQEKASRGNQNIRGFSLIQFLYQLCTVVFLAQATNLVSFV